MSNDSDPVSPDLIPTGTQPPSRPPRSGLRRRTATLVTMGGLTAGAVAGGLIVSHAADSSSTSSSSSSTAAASPSPGSSSQGSNEDPTHERNESPQREAEENSGNLHPGGGPRGGMHGGLQTEDLQLVAKAIGITSDQLQTELSGGKTIAAVAKEHNADLNALISTWVASENTEIDDRVSSGALTKAQGDQQKADTQQRITDAVNGVHHDGMH